MKISWGSSRYLFLTWKIFRGFPTFNIRHFNKKLLQGILRVFGGFSSRILFERFWKVLGVSWYFIFESTPRNLRIFESFSSKFFLKGFESILEVFRMFFNLKENWRLLKGLQGMLRVFKGFFFKIYFARFYKNPPGLSDAFSYLKESWDSSGAFFNFKYTWTSRNLRGFWSFFSKV